MSNHIPIENPYAGIPRDKLVNINFWVSPEDHKYLTGVYPYQGRWQNTCASLIKNLVEHLKERGITTWTTETDVVVAEFVQHKIPPKKVANPKKRKDEQPYSAGSQILGEGK